MNALVLSEYKLLQIKEVATPQLHPGDALIQVAACGICGSDVHGYDGSSGRRLPPVVMGHEAAGIVAALGSGVTGHQVGDRVTFDSTVFCNACEFCKRGEINLCNNRQVVGVSCPEFHRDGAFAEYVTVPARILYKLPDALGFPEAAMLEAVSVALHAIRVSELKGGETALVIGAGMIGVLVQQAAIAAGCSQVFVADVDASRLAMAETLGATQTFNASGPALVAEVMRLTDGRGVDIAFEAVGRDETVSTAVECVRKGGTVTLVGNIAQQVTVPLQKIVTRQIRLQGSCASAGEYPEAMALLASGKIQVAPLISAVAPLTDGPEWFARLYAREPNLLKVILDPRPNSRTVAA